MNQNPWLGSIAMVLGGLVALFTVVPFLVIVAGAVSVLWPVILLLAALIVLLRGSDDERG